MSVFARSLADRNPSSGARRWVFVPYDQLSADVGPLACEAPEDIGIVLLENTWKGNRRPYHKQKLALILSNMRHFALEQARRGVAVRYELTHGPYANALRGLVRELGPLTVMEPAERELRIDLSRLVEEGLLRIIPHEGWLTRLSQFEESAATRSHPRMDAFYRRVRRDTGILMNGAKPVGGKYSFDPENRLAWKGQPPAPQPPGFRRDPIKEEVGKLIVKAFADHPGTLDLDALPATAADAEALWDWAKESCLEHFGPFEDAMSTASRGLFHTRISALLNTHRLLPERVVKEVASLDIALPSKEGFIRQVLGWREYVRHVHFHTDGFRQIGDTRAPCCGAPGDGGYGRWRGRPWRAPAPSEQAEDGGAAPSFLGADAPLPPAFWGEPSGLHCLDQTVEAVWEEGYGHHITRLMVLGNLATLLDVSPRELTDWFWAAYTDAFDWVVEPNVLGMGTYAVGEFMVTKPYVSGAAYIHRMGDFCDECRFDPKRNCPITRLYWAFLEWHRDALGTNRRLLFPMNTLARRTAGEKPLDRAVFEWVEQTLAAGEQLELERSPVG
jgi:deoxyribodipyrimidine photolyase-related protein